MYYLFILYYYYTFIFTRGKPFIGTFGTRACSPVVLDSAFCHTDFAFAMVLNRKGRQKAFSLPRLPYPSWSSGSSPLFCICLARSFASLAFIRSWNIFSTVLHWSDLRLSSWRPQCCSQPHSMYTRRAETRYIKC